MGEARLFGRASLLRLHFRRACPIMVPSAGRGAGRVTVVYLDEEDYPKQRAEDIEEYGKYTKTTKFVEEVAKDKLGLVYEGEIIFKPEK